MRTILGGTIYLASAALGVLAFFYPFVMLSRAVAVGGEVSGQEASLVTATLVALAMIGVLLEAQGQAMNARTVAALGILVAITAVLRFFALMVPGLGGFSPMFAPILLSGYVFGGRFGFLMGAFSFLVSALITGGVGPWLPYQMFASAWIGMTAGWLGTALGRHRGSVPGIGLLCALGFIWGLLFGAVMNLYFWPFAMGPVDQSWVPGTAFVEGVKRYAVFYVTTSLWWDLARSIGNVVLLLLIGPAMIRALDRFRRRFAFQVAIVRA